MTDRDIVTDPPVRIESDQIGTVRWAYVCA